MIHICMHILYMYLYSMAQCSVVSGTGTSHPQTQNAFFPFDVVFYTELILLVDYCSVRYFDTVVYAPGIIVVRIFQIFSVSIRGTSTKGG